MAQIRMFSAQRQHLPLDQRALHVVILEDHVLLEALDGVVALRVDELRQQHLQDTHTAYSSTKRKLSAFQGHSFPSDSHPVDKTTPILKVKDYYSVFVQFTYISILVCKFPSFLLRTGVLCRAVYQCTETSMIRPLPRGWLLIVA